ncbi:uncharacterized protein LOC144533805 [Sander vitreus]
MDQNIMYSADELPATDCWHPISGNAFNIPTNVIHQTAEPSAEAALPLNQNHRFQTSRLHPAPYSAELHNGYIPADTKRITAKNTESSLSLASELTSAATDRVGLNPERPGTVERRETVRPEVQTIRVKPQSRFLSSGLQLNQEPVFHHANSQISNPTAVSVDGNRWPSQQLPEHRGPNVREARTDLSSPDHQRLPGPSPDHQRLPGPSPDHQRLPGPSTDQQKVVYLYPNQQKRVESALVQSVSETENGGGQEVPQTGASNIRVRLTPGLSGRLQSWDQPKLQNLQNLSVLNSPSAGGAGFTDSDLQTAGSDCGAQYGASDHQGILRGTLTDLNIILLLA